jgi:hypothetical protein
MLFILAAPKPFLPDECFIFLVLLLIIGILLGIGLHNDRG